MNGLAATKVCLFGLMVLGGVAAMGPAGTGSLFIDSYGANGTVTATDQIGPQADAGGPYSTGYTRSYELDGTNSTVRNSNLTYSWQITAGPGRIRDANSTTPEYRPCENYGSGEATVELTVTDEFGRTDSDQATVSRPELIGLLCLFGGSSSNNQVAVAQDSTAGMDNSSPIEGPPTGNVTSPGTQSPTPTPTIAPAPNASATPTSTSTPDSNGIATSTPTPTPPPTPTPTATPSENTTATPTPSMTQAPTNDSVDAGTATPTPTQTSTTDNSSATATSTPTETTANTPVTETTGTEKDT